MKINVENLKRLVRTRKRGIPAELNKAARNGRKGDITRDKVLEDAGVSMIAVPPLCMGAK